MKVLFVVGSLQSGGVSKSMINLLNVWDVDKYDTSLLLCSKDKDIFSRYVPKGVRILYDPVIEHVMGRVSSAKWLLFHGHLLLSLGVLLRMLIGVVSKPLAGRMIARMMPVIDKQEYDLVVDYGGQQLLYYMIDKLNGKVKVSFFHSDYDKWNYYYSADKLYYPHVDKIFTISEICSTSLKKYFPDCSDKIEIMENVSVPEVITRLSEEDVELPEKQFKFVTVGHVCYNKGIDFAIDAASILQAKGYDFLWIFVGLVQDTKWLEEVSRRGLTDYFLFTGAVPNPYPYIRLADVFVHPSRFEGKSIALDEAKILCKPVVVTNFSTVNDQFTDSLNASICDMSGEDVVAKIIELLEDNELKKQYVANLGQRVEDNSSEVKKLYSLLEVNEQNEQKKF